MSDPVHIAAIDAGSNAVRLSIVSRLSPLSTSNRSSRRTLSAAPRRRRLPPPPLQRRNFSKKASKPFRHLNEIMDEFGVTKYRAVATSASAKLATATRSSAELNKQSGIALEVISANGRIPPRPRSRPRRSRPRSPAALHRRPGRRQPGTQHLARSRGATKRPSRRRHRPSDDHSESSRRHPPFAGRAGPPICPRATRITIAQSPQPRRTNCRRPGRQCRNSRNIAPGPRRNTACPRCSSLCSAIASPTF